MNRRLAAALPLWAFLFLGPPASAQEWTPEGKERTDRSIYAAVVVEASPEEVYRLWVTPEGVRRFLAVDAEIGDGLGGSYHIYFLPRDHPQAAANSTRGARILAAEPGRFLAFEWTATPTAPDLDRDGPPLWIEIRLQPVGPDMERTAVELTAHGFGHGPDWDTVYEFDSRSWVEILYALDRVLVDPEYRPAWLGGPA